MKQKKFLLIAALLIASIFLTLSDCSNQFMEQLLKDHGPSAPVLKGIRVKYGSIKMDYGYGVPFDLAGLVIIEKWSNGDVEMAYGEDFFDDDFEIDTNNYDELTPGTYPVTITYKEKTDTFNVYVNPPGFEGYRFEFDAVKKIYERDEPLDLTGFTVIEIWDDGDKEPLVYRDDLKNIIFDDISGYDKSNPGDQTVSVTYKGVTVYFDVTVKDYPGSESNPWIITDASSLVTSLSKNLDGHYKQGGDIDLSDLTTGDWTPIGNDTNRFSGSYDGGGHSIKNLIITTKGNFGLFGCIGSSGVVKNLGVTYVDINPSNNGTNDIGGLVVHNYGTVINCYVTGTIIKGSNRVGAIVGENCSTGLVKNCYATIEVSGATSVGGIVGANDTGGRVENCVALNPNIAATQTNPSYGSIAGSSSSLLSANYARDDMKINGTKPWVANSKGKGIDGTSISDQEYRDPDWWKALFDDDWWEDRPLPDIPL